MSSIWGQGSSRKSSRTDESMVPQTPVVMSRMRMEEGPLSPAHTGSLGPRYTLAVLLPQEKPVSQLAPKSAQVSSPTPAVPPAAKSVKSAWALLLDQCKAKFSRLEALTDSVPSATRKSERAPSPRAAGLMESGQKAALSYEPDPTFDVPEEPSIFRQWCDVIQASITAQSNQPEANAYLRQMVSNGVAKRLAARRASVLHQLLSLLRKSARDPASYRQVVERYLQLCRPEDHEVARACARDYYYFWLGDLRHRPGSMVIPDLKIRRVGDLRNAPLESLVRCMKEEPGHCSQPALSFYLGQQFENGVSGEELACREEILKVLLVLLRGRPFLPDSYRKAVDKLLHISPSGDRASVVGLTREFFYYWIAFPPAATRNVG